MSFYIPPTDTDGSPIQRGKVTKTGWGIQCKAIEFQTSVLGSFSDLDVNGDDYGHCSMKFYNASDEELTTQNDIDTYCVRTILYIEPNFDYEVIGGELWQLDALSSDVRFHFAHTLSGHAFCSNFNARAIAVGHCKDMDGRAAKLMPHDDPVDHSGQVFLQARHSAGFKHKFQVVLEFYKA